MVYSESTDNHQPIFDLDLQLQNHFRPHRMKTTRNVPTQFIKFYQVVLKLLSIYIPWPFPPVWGLADNTKETTKTMGISLRFSSNDEGPSQVWMALFRYFTIVLFFTSHFFSFSQGMQTRERAHCARSVFPVIKKKKKKKKKTQPIPPVFHNLRRFIDAISPTAPTTRLPL